MSEGEDSPAMKELTSTSWGYMIAFLLPGVFGVYALSYWAGEADVLIQPILKSETTVGPSMIFLIVAVGMGLCLAATRYWVLEKLAYGVFGKKCLSAALHKDLKPDKLTLIRAYAEEHYRYHQFYGGCFTAGLLLYTGWYRAQWLANNALTRHAAYVTVGFILFELLLERSSYDAFSKYVHKCNALAK
jgi:hypothetical protein